MKILRVLASLAFLTSLAGCGGSGSDGSGGGTTPPPPATPQRGSLIDNPPQVVASYSTTQLLALLGGTDLGKTFLQLSYTPECSVTVYHLTYDTVDPKGNITPASGALMVPSGSGSGCSGSLPLVVYAHGTTTDRTFDISQFAAANNAEGLLLAAV